MRKLALLALALAMCLALASCATVEQHQKMQAQLVKDVMAVARKQPETIKVLEIEAHEGQPITINAKKVTVQVANTTVVDMLRAVPKLKAPYEDAVNSTAGGLTNALTLFSGGYWVDRIMATAMSRAGYNTHIGGDSIGRDKAGRDQVGGDWTGGDRAGRDIHRDSHNSDSHDQTTENTTNNPSPAEP